MKKRLIGLFAGAVAALLMAGCDVVSKAEHQVVVKERDELRKKVDGLEKRPPVNVVEGLSKDQCTALATELVEKSCTAKVATSTKPSGKTANDSRTTARRRVPVAGQSTATATATGNATATATATAGGAAPAVAAPAPDFAQAAAEPRHHVCRVIVDGKVVADFSDRSANYLKEYVRPHGEGPKCVALKKKFWVDHPQLTFEKTVKD